MRAGLQSLAAPALVAVFALLLPAVSGGAARAETPGAELRREVANAPHTQRLLLEVAARSRELDRREGALSQRERAVADLEGELGRRLREWDALRVSLEGRIAELQEGLGDRVAQLAKTYGVMPPAQAAELVESLDHDLATAVIAGMKTKQAAKVLSELPTRRASDLSKRLVTPLVLEDVEEEGSR